ncbi:MAG TPA: ABC transporter substrate-binding protein, partial [Burkholderiaceae bacterium]
GPSSANSAGWPEVTTHFMPIGFQIAFNAYAMSLPKWNALPADQKAKMEAAFRKYEGEVWAYSRELFDDAVRCNVGKEPCKTVKKYALKDVPVTAGDQQLIRDALSSVSYPIWSELCDKSYDKCSAIWKQTIGPLVGMK